MGRLIKNHWARLVVLVAGTYQVAAAVHGFIWPKFFWDFVSRGLVVAVNPPVLQSLNLLFGISAIALEWPLFALAGSALHRNIALRLVLLPLFALAAALLYQATNAAIYYMVAEALYFWAYSEGEVVCPEPWTLPRRAPKPSSKIDQKLGKV